MERTEIFEKVKEILVDKMYCESSEVSEGSDLGRDLQLDSLDKIDTIIECEHIFGIYIDDTSVTSISSVCDLCNVIESKVNK